MAQINETFIAKIRLSLQESVFSENDFNLELPSSGSVLVKIIFKHNRDYWISASEESRRESVQVQQQFTLQSKSETRTYKTYVIKATPGEYKKLDEDEPSGLEELTDRIPKWCRSIRDELYVNAPKADPLEELRAKFQEDIEKKIDDPEAFFAAEEVEAIRAKLEETFDRLSELSEEFSLNKNDLKEIRKEFDEFKQSATVYPKGVWARVTANGIVKSVGRFINTPEGRAFLLKQAARLFGGNGT